MEEDRLLDIIEELDEIIQYYTDGIKQAEPRNPSIVEMKMLVKETGLTVEEVIRALILLAKPQDIWNH